VDLVGGGAGAFGRHPSFEQACLVAWRHWLGSFSAGPMLARVTLEWHDVGHETVNVDGWPMSRIEAALIPPHANELAKIPDDEDKRSDLSVDVDVDTIKNAVEDVMSDLGRLPKDYDNGRRVARARLRIAGAVQSLLDLDHDLRGVQVQAAQKRLPPVTVTSPEGTVVWRGDSEAKAAAYLDTVDDPRVTEGLYSIDTRGER